MRWALSRFLMTGTIDALTPSQEPTLALRAVSTETKRKPRQRAAQHNHFPIIGVGSSAGGLEPFLDFLRNIPADSGPAITHLQHSEPTHVSELPHIPSRRPNM